MGAGVRHQRRLYGSLRTFARRDGDRFGKQVRAVSSVCTVKRRKEGGGGRRGRENCQKKNCIRKGGVPTVEYCGVTSGAGWIV